MNGMEAENNANQGSEPAELELSDEDILDALAHVPGYIDISTEDFRTVYHLAWRHALQRLQSEQKVVGGDDTA